MAKLDILINFCTFMSVNMEINNKNLAVKRYVSQYVVSKTLFVILQLYAFCILFS